MDESNIDTQEAAWTTRRNRIEAKTDIILISPRFTSIERFLMFGGGTPFEMYGSIMEIIFPKYSEVAPNIMNDLKMKATNNLKAIRTINGLNGLFGLHDQIWNKTYTGASDLIFWMNGSLDLHNIVELPVNVDRLIHEGESRVFNFFESVYPLNIRKDAESGLKSAFQFWNLPNTRMRFDELLDMFLFEYKDFSNNPESTFDGTNFGIVNMMKAIINLQRTILSCTDGIYDKDCFVDDTLLQFRSMSKEERDLTLMMELKEILGEVYISSEYIKSLFLEELNSETFTVEKQQYRRKKNLLICYRGIQFLIERKFEVFINITLCQKVIFPTLKEMVVEEYLSDINNDMRVCLLRAGTVIIRSEIWNKFLCIRDGLINKTLDKTPLKNKKRSGVLKSKRPKTDGITLYDKKSKDIYVDKISCSIDTKCSSYLEKRTVKMKSDTNTEIERHKLVIDKPWFSHSMSEINSFSSIDSPVSAPIVSEEFIPDAVPSIPYSSSIYDINTYSETNQQTQSSSATDHSRGSRLRPRFVVDKISKLFIFRKK